jgi:nicotinate-nucleotide adenylyltransferase
VWFITAAHPPHKPQNGTCPYEHRQRMVELACEADPRFHAPRLEEGAGASYTIHTIERVRAGLKAGDTLYFLIGADAFAELGAWYRSEDVCAAVEFIVVARPGYEYPVPPGARVHKLETLALEVSSSEIRSALERGERPADLPDRVADYIAEHALYRGVNV